MLISEAFVKLHVCVCEGGGVQVGGGFCVFVFCFFFNWRGFFFSLAAAS